MEKAVFDTIQRCDDLGKELEQYNNNYLDIPNDLLFKCIKNTIYIENLDKIILKPKAIKYEDVSYLIFNTLMQN